MEKTKYHLYNKDIGENFKDEIFHLMLSDFNGAMAYWLASNSHRAKINIDKPLKAFSDYLQQKYFRSYNDVKGFTYDQLNSLISEDVFIAIPELLELNQIENNDYYDLCALARNVFYMICREQITQPL